MIRSRTSLTGIFSKGRDPWGPPGYSTNRITRNFPDGLAAQVQDSIAQLGGPMGSVPLLDPWFDQVHDLVSAGDEKLRDQSPVAAPPGSFRAHQARLGLRQRLVQRGVPVRRAHSRRVARKLAETREQLLAGLLATQPAELGCVLVCDACSRECRGQGRLVELRIAARRRKAPDIDER